MQIHDLKRKHPNTKKVKVGRGGKRGKTSGRGHKGQKARAGRKIRPEMRDVIKKIPKKRGHGKNRATSYNARNVSSQTLNVSTLDSIFNDGDKINVRVLLARELVNKKKGKNPKVKILGGGEIKKKLNIEGLLVSDIARDKIEKVGGTIK